MAARKAPLEPVAAVGMPAVAGTLKAHNLAGQGSLVLPEALLEKKTATVQSAVCLLSIANSLVLLAISIKHKGMEPF